MKLTRGKLRGRLATVHQFANDWMTIDPSDGLGPLPSVLNPASAFFTGEEIDEMKVAPGSQVGTFWTEYEVRDSGDPDYPFKLVRLARYR